MVKKTDTTETPVVADNAPVSNQTVLEYNGFRAEISEIATAGQAYLWQYGFAKSLQDSVAGLAKELKESGVPADEIPGRIKSAMQERFDKILAGTVGTRSTGPRVMGFDKILRDVAERELAAKIKLPTKRSDAFTVAGKNWPNFGAFVAEYIASPKNNDRLTALAKEEEARVAELAQTDISDLL